MRYLTKSRFTLGLECPTKLFYTRKHEEYADRKGDDDFLRALADGGHQVGALAQAYHPGGIRIDAPDHDEALRQTDELLQRKSVIIFEAAFRYKNLFVRTDVLIKEGNQLQLIEVKAKSCRPDENFFTKGGRLTREWKKYMYDMAFQDYVVRKAKPHLVVQPLLMCADKSKTATVDGLNRRFQINRDATGRSQITTTGPIDLAALGERILHKFDVADIVTGVQNGALFDSPLSENHVARFANLPGLDPTLRNAALSRFETTVFFLAHHYERDVKIPPVLGTVCKACEFKTEPDDPTTLKSGFRECWREAAGFTEPDFHQPLILDIWGWSGRTEKIEAGHYFQRDLTEADFPNEHTKANGGLTAKGRRWLQRQMSVKGETQSYLNRDVLRQYFADWRYPLHFIDFETSMVALPYHVGRSPYEQIAFQFSHHRVAEDGAIRHQGQWLLAEPGVFPNFEFVRALRKELGQDQGTIFRYSAHENTVLNQIRRQLLASAEPDRQALVDFVDSITHPTKGSANEADEFTAGPRDMVDLREVVLEAYYHPAMKGSNSIKAVLPAILNSSVYLKERYTAPVYGSPACPSLNFKPFAVVQLDAQGRVRSPYLQLLPVLDGMDQNLVRSELFYGEDEVINEGGAAAVAYGRIQFTAMTEAEREQVRQSLLKYCEIDTLAMVVLWESFRAELI
jgi:hypothetical protein